jgi:hypothetical protein
MWEPQPLTTLRASKACRGENFTFYHTVKTVTGMNNIASVLVGKEKSNTEQELKDVKWKSISL